MVRWTFGNSPNPTKKKSPEPPVLNPTTPTVSLPAEKNVFINCPYDKPYLPLLRAMLFTIKYCGFQPRIALERFDSAEVRLQKIMELIKLSQLSIHDLSRVISRKKGEYFRLNMPLELGLDLGARYFNQSEFLQNKKILILETIPFGIQKALSDLSFADTKCHEANDEELCYLLREWFCELGNDGIPYGSEVWESYIEFSWYLTDSMLSEGKKQKDIDRMTVPDYLRRIDEKLAG